MTTLFPLEYHSPDVPNMRHEQHELFWHIGIWLNVIIAKNNPIEPIGRLSNRMDSNFFLIPYWQFTSRDELHLSVLGNLLLSHVTSECQISLWDFEL